MKQSVGRIRVTFFRFLRKRFDLVSDSATEGEVIENIERSVPLRGTNLWVLIFAIVVASVGLNVNSTAVIIGAMLISPLMGPIMGFGLSLGTYDFELMKMSLRNFLLAVSISLIVSTLYFAITPLTEADSELLARTTPTVWDVLIAFFGGLAGIVAQTRKDRTSTVIPGVAIATALMPPLCTAGYGLGTGQLNYFLGALYLFMINAVFISLATFVLVRFLNFSRKQIVDKAQEKRLRSYMLAVTVIMIVPSVLFAYKIVGKTIFENSVRNYITSCFDMQDSQVFDYTIEYDSDGSSIDIVLIGKVLSSDVVEQLKERLVYHKLKGTELNIRYADGGSQRNSSSSVDVDKLYNISSRLLDEKDRKIEELQKVISSDSASALPAAEIAKEFASLVSTPERFALSKMPVYDSLNRKSDYMLICYIIMPGGENATQSIDTEAIAKWLKARTKSNNVKIVID